MKIAVTFENGQVFQHFGHTEQFKLYEVEGGKVVASEVIDTNGSGHEALADFLAQRGVGALVCGGIGDGAQAALSASGIEICSGAQGDADEAVAAFLRGELVSAGVNCDHHDHDHEEGGGCGGSCGSCGAAGGCMELTVGEIGMLRTLAQIPFLPVARKMGEDIPVYLEDADKTQEEYSLILQCLEKRGLISIDYDKPLKSAYSSDYDAYPIRGSFALTLRGQQVLDILDLQGIG